MKTVTNISYWLDIYNYFAKIDSITRKGNTVNVIGMNNRFEIVKLTHTYQHTKVAMILTKKLKNLVFSTN